MLCMDKFDTIDKPKFLFCHRSSIVVFSLFFSLFHLYVRVYLCIHVRTCVSFEVSTLIAVCRVCPAWLTKFFRSESKETHFPIDLFRVFDGRWLIFIAILLFWYSINLIHFHSLSLFLLFWKKIRKMKEGKNKRGVIFF